MSSFLLSEFGGDYGQFFLPWTHFVDFLEVFILGDWSPLIFKTGVSFSRCSLAPLSLISGNPDSPPAFLVFFSTPSGGLIIQEPSPGATSGKEPACQCKRCMRCGFHPWVGKISWRRAQQPTPPLQYSFLENPRERGDWWAMVHRVTKSHVWLRWLRTHTRKITPWQLSVFHAPWKYVHS